MEVTARDAIPSDLPELIRLAEAAIAELRPRRGGEIWYRTRGRQVPVEAGLRADLDDPTTTVVVGTIDDVPVGYGVVHVAVMQDTSLLGVVTDLFTEPDARGVSVGEEMMNALVAVAEAAGCVGVDSIALPGDRHTKNFFETFGLVARSIEVHRRFDDDA